MPRQQLTDDQRAPGRAQEDPGELNCARCQTALSRRLIGKPDIQTEFSEVTYRCPKCGVTVKLWMRN